MRIPALLIFLLGSAIAPIAPARARGAVLDVTTFGAIPDDSIDDADAINAAVQAAAPGDTVVIPAGVFNVSSQVFALSNVTITGGGRDATILRRTGNSTAPLLGIVNARAASV